MTALTDRKRLNYVDMAKALGIFLVTYGHIATVGNPVTKWGSLFKIAVFYIVAGYILAMKDRWKTTSIRDYIKKLLWSLFLPYVSFSVIAIIVRGSVTFFKRNDVIARVKSDLFATVTLHGISTLWFLPSLFIGQLIFFLLLKSRSKLLMGSTLVWPVAFGVFAQDALEKMADGSSTLLYYLALAVSKGIVAVWFILIGYIGFQMIKRFQVSSSFRFALGILLSGFTILLTLCDFHINFNGMELGTNPLYFFLGGVTGSFGALFTFEGLEKHFKLELFTYFGRNSLILMATQRCLMLVNLAVAGWKGVAGLESKLCTRYYAETFAIFVLVLLMAYGVTEFINQKAPFLIRKPHSS